MIETIEILRNNLEHLEKEHARNEYSDDFYMTSGRYDKMESQIRRIKEEIAILEEKMTDGNA